MSLSIKRILELPSMRGAELVAGAGALDRTVSSVSVLEYSNPDDVQNALFEAISFEGNEVVITAFASIADDPDAQIKAVQRLIKAGEVGLILYYVGILMPEIDQRLIRLADENDFAMIRMPSLKSLRYSDAISDISEAIMKEERQDGLIVEILEEMSRLRSDERTVTTVLKMLRDRLRAGFILGDRDGRVLNISTYPHGREDDVRTMFENGSLDHAWAIRRTFLESPTRGKLVLTMLRENGIPLSDEQVETVRETVHLFLAIWSPDHGKAVISQLVKAILQDESLKMRRLADMFSIDVGSLDTMFMVRPKKAGVNILDDSMSRISAFVTRPVMDEYEDYVVLFLASSMGPDVIQAIADALTGDDRILVTIYNLKDTGDVRRAYLEASASAMQAHLTFARDVLSHAHIRMIDYCMKAIGKGEDEIRDILSLLDPLTRQSDHEDLVRTLEVWALDAGMSTLQTSKILDVHNNTVKYRIRRISNLLGDDVTRAPLSVLLYRALMLTRILRLQSD